MARWGKLFSGKGKPKDNSGQPHPESRTEWFLPAFDKSQIRLLLFLDHELRGRHLLLDSQTVRKVEPAPQQPPQNKASDAAPKAKGAFTRRLCWRPPVSAVTSSSPAAAAAAASPAEQEVPKYQFNSLHSSPDVQLLGEMIFGTAALSYKGPSLKVHTLKCPQQLLVSAVFIPSCKSSRGTNNASVEECSTVDPLMGPASLGAATGPRDIAPNGKAVEQKSEIAHSLPMDVPKNNRAATCQTRDHDSGFSNSSLTSSGSWQQISFPPSPSSSCSLNSNSCNSLQRRYRRSLQCSLDHGVPKPQPRFTYEDSSSSCAEPVPARLRRPKVGMGVLFRESDDESAQRIQEFFFSHVTLVDARMNKLRLVIEAARFSKPNWQVAVMEAFEEFQQEIYDLYTAPRLPNPVWLDMMALTLHRRMLCDAFMKEFSGLIDKYDTKHTNFFLSTLLTAALTYHLSWVPTVIPAGVTTSRTYYSDKHTAKWLDLLTRSHPYNPLWAQLSDLCGAIGSPLRLARTVVVGKRPEVVRRFLYMLSYFIRCTEIHENAEECMVEQECTAPTAGECGRGGDPSLSSYSADSSSGGRCGGCAAVVEMHSFDSLESPAVVAAEYCRNLPRLASVHSCDGAVFGDGNGDAQSAVRCERTGRLGEPMPSSETAAQAEGGAPYATAGGSRDAASPAGEHRSRSLRGSASDATTIGIAVSDVPISSSAEKVVQWMSSCADSGCSESSGPTMFGAGAAAGGGSSNCGSSRCVLADSGPVPNVRKEHVRALGREAVAAAVSFPPLPSAASPGVGGCGKQTSSAGEGEQLKCTGSSAAQMQTLSGRDQLRRMFSQELDEFDEYFVDSPGNEQAPTIGRFGQPASSPHPVGCSIFDEYFEDGCAVPIGLLTLQQQRAGGSSTPAAATALVVCNSPCCRLQQCATCSFVPPSPAAVTGDENGAQRHLLLKVAKPRGFLTWSEQQQQQSQPLPLPSASASCSDCRQRLGSFDASIRRSSCSSAPAAAAAAAAAATAAAATAAAASGGGCSSAAIVCRRLPSSSNACDESSSCGTPQTLRCTTPVMATAADGRRRHASDCGAACPDPVLPAADSFCKYTEVPMPRSRSVRRGSRTAADLTTTSPAQTAANFGRSQLGGYSDHYLSDFVLHGTSDNQFERKLQSDLDLAVNFPVLDEPVAEAVCIIANTDTWLVQVASSMKTTEEKKIIMAAPLVVNMVESVQSLYKQKMSSEFCMMHLEDTLREMYFKSRMLAEYVNSQKKVNMDDLSAMLGFDISDLPLLLSVAATHSTLLTDGLY